MRTRFKDEALDKQFEKDGYIVIPNWANADQVSNMKMIINSCQKTLQLDKNILNTLLLEDKEMRSGISDRLMEQLKPSIEEYFFDYLPYFGYALIKPFSPNMVNIHRDASVLNEEKFEYITTWLPLEDVNKDNGCIFIFPESQKLFTYEVPIGVDWPYPQLTNILNNYVVDLPMKAGDLLLFSSRTLHGSYSNQSKESRVVVASVLIHPDSEMLFYYYDRNTNRVKVYEVDPWFYFRNEFGDPNGKYPLKGSFTFDPPKVSEKAVKEFYEKNPVKASFFSKLLCKFGANS